MNATQNSSLVSMVVNGDTVTTTVKAHSNLLSLLRNELQLSGSKQGCATGDCGACNVLVNNVATSSCQMKLSSLDNCAVQTIEDIVKTPLGRRITHALTLHDAAQCGYCLPGIVVATYAEMLTAETPNPVNALQRSLCRCGTHSRILNTLQEVMSNTSVESSGSDNQT